METTVLKLCVVCLGPFTPNKMTPTHQICCSRNCSHIREIQRRPPAVRTERKRICDANWRAAHRERVREAQKRWRIKHPEQYRRIIKNADLQKSFGITIEDYERMYKEQQGLCAICKVDKPTGKKKYFSVDHEHATGKVRGLLCGKCNVKLGVIENQEWMEAANAYLRKHSAE